MFAKSILAIAVLATSVAAQTNASYIDPGQVDAQTQAAWCNSQENVCNTLCNKATNANTCTPTTLEYKCLCASNNSAPGLQYYETSMPYNICEKSFALCIAAAPNDLIAQDNCTNNIQSQCATIPLSDYTPSAATTSAAASSSVASSTSAPATSTASTVASTTSAAASTSATAKSAAADLAAEYSLGLVAAGFVAAFGFLL